MLQNYVITAYRSFKKNLTHTILNVVGLGIGIACVLSVFAIIDFEYSFDDWHSQKGDIYRFTTKYYGDNWTDYNGIVPYPIGKVLKEEFPEIKEVIEFHGPMDQVLSFIDSEDNFQVFREKDILMTGSSYFKEMDFNVLAGNIDDLEKPNKIFLTKRLADKYFADGDAIGKIINYRNEVAMEVAGILEDHPGNTNLPFNAVVSFATLKEQQKEIWNLWHMTWGYSAYVVLEDNVNIDRLSQQIDKAIDSYADPEDEEEWAKTEVVLQPLDEIHTDERYGDGYNYVVPSMIIYAFIFLGILVLGTGILNFVNLNTAIAVQRSKEVGVRKTLGSSKKQLIIKFLFETLFVVVCALLLGLMMSQVLMDLLQKELFVISYELTFTSNVIAFSVILALAITLLAGFYPSMVLSGYKPVEAIKNRITLRKGSGSLNVRRGLIVTQFVLTSILIISALIVSAQMNFVKNRDMGFNSQDVVLIDTPAESNKNPEGLVTLLKSRNYVNGICRGFGPPYAGNNWNNSYTIPGEKQIDGNSANMKFMDENYLDFYDIKILEGRNITNKNGRVNDTTYNILVNEQLITSLGWKTPKEAVGKSIKRNRDLMKIVGVVEDFNVNSAKGGLRPVILSYEEPQLKQIAFRISAKNLQTYLKDIEATFKSYYPDEYFEFEVLKTQMDSHYIIENLLLKVINFISFVSILLSAMGLYGLVSYMANRNAKVIGIRKVFGASTGNILSLFTKEYTRLIVIAFLLGAPLVHFIIDIWMQEFVFRIPLGPKYYVIGFGITIFISLVTVGYRSLIAATANPIESLRYE